MGDATGRGCLDALMKRGMGLDMRLGARAPAANTSSVSSSTSSGTETCERLPGRPALVWLGETYEPIRLPMPPKLRRLPAFGGGAGGRPGDMCPSCLCCNAADVNADGDGGGSLPS